MGHVMRHVMRHVTMWGIKWQPSVDQGGPLHSSVLLWDLDTSSHAGHSEERVKQNQFD